MESDLIYYCWIHSMNIHDFLGLSIMNILLHTRTLSTYYRTHFCDWIWQVIVHLLFHYSYFYWYYNNAQSSHVD